MMTTPEPNRTHEKPYTAPALLDFASVCDRVGRERGRPARLAFWRGAKSGTFPAPVKTSPGGSRIFWRRDEIERWIAERPRAIYAKARNTAEPKRDPITMTQTPANCAECGSGLRCDGGSLYLCTDVHGLGCDWRAILEDGTDAA